MHHLNLQLPLQPKPQLRRGCAASPPLSARQHRGSRLSKADAGVVRQRRGTSDGVVAQLHVEGYQAPPTQRKLSFDDNYTQDNSAGQATEPALNYDFRCLAASAPAVDVLAPIVTPADLAAETPRECENAMVNMNAVLSTPAAVPSPTGRQGLRPLGSSGTAEKPCLRPYLAATLSLSDMGRRTLVEATPPAGLFWAQLPAAAQTFDPRFFDSLPRKKPASSKSGRPMSGGSLSLSGVSICGLRVDSEKLPSNRSCDDCFTLQFSGQSGTLPTGSLPVAPSFHEGAPLDKICNDRLQDGLSHRTAKVILMVPVSNV